MPPAQNSWFTGAPKEKPDPDDTSTADWSNTSRKPSDDGGKYEPVPSTEEEIVSEEPPYAHLLPELLGYYHGLELDEELQLAVDTQQDLGNLWHIGSRAYASQIVSFLALVPLLSFTSMSMTTFRPIGCLALCLVYTSPAYCATRAGRQSSALPSHVFFLSTLCLCSLSTSLSFSVHLSVFALCVALEIPT